MMANAITLDQLSTVEGSGEGGEGAGAGAAEGEPSPTTGYRAGWSARGHRARCPAGGGQPPGPGQAESLPPAGARHT